MKCTELSRTYLEGLTTEELIVLADRFDIDVPPDLGWNFIVETLLEINPVDNAESAENSENAKNTKHSDAPARKEEPFDEEAERKIPPGAVRLPEQYNISFVDVLIRDPMWIHVFWEIKNQDKEALEAGGDPNRYYLKICPIEDIQKAFTVHIRPQDTAWYVGIPDPENSYKVELCAVAGKKEVLIASSGVFTMPVLFEPRKKELNPRSFSHLQVLSGVNDFSILRSRERNSK